MEFSYYFNHHFSINSLIFRHHRDDRKILTAMKAFFSTIELEDGEDDLKEAWSVGEACVARLGSEWYRGQVVADNGKEVAVIFVDLGNVRKVAYRDLRIAREVIVDQNIFLDTLWNCKGRQKPPVDISIKILN